MVVSQFSILLDKPEAVYLAGQSVTGKLLFVVATDTESFKSIHLDCTGFTKVNFKNQENHLDMDFLGGFTLETKTTTYTGSQIHLKISLPLKTAADGNHLMFEVGQHIFSFDFTFPNSIPSSVEGEYGHIRYVLTGQLKRTDDVKQKKKDEYCSMNITFNNLVDLNLNPVAKMPASGTASKNVTCWCCFRGGPITAQAWMNKSGYAPGEILYFNASVEDLSGKTMKGSEVRLIQEIVYHAKSGRQLSIRVIRDASHASFGSSDVWENVPFLIPYVAPSDATLSSLIKVSYRIEFTVLPGSCRGVNFTIPLDVIIGNIPVNSSSVDSAGIPKENPESKMNTSSSVIDAPPKYDDCFFAGSSGKDGDAASNFTPRYVTYVRTDDDETS